MNEVWLSKKEIEQKYGITDSILNKIRAKSGIKAKGKGTGARWPLLQICKWLVDNPPRVKHDKAEAMRKRALEVLNEYGATSGKQKQARVGRAELTTDVNDEPGLEAALDRLRDAERSTYLMWREAIANGDDGGPEFRKWQQALDLLRKAEDNLIAVLTKRRELLPAAEVKTWMSRQIEAAKAHLLDLPDKLAPQLEGLPWPQIQKILQGEISDALNKLSADIK
jgi:hypothetical protein